MIRIYREEIKVEYTKEQLEMFLGHGLAMDTSLYIEFDVEGARELKSKLELALNNKEAIVNIDESSYLDIEKPIKTVSIINNKEDDAIIQYIDGNLIFRLYEEGIEDFIIKNIDYYIHGKKFWP